MLWGTVKGRFQLLHSNLHISLTKPENDNVMNDVIFTTPTKNAFSDVVQRSHGFDPQIWLEGVSGRINFRYDTTSKMEKRTNFGLRNDDIIDLQTIIKIYFQVLITSTITCRSETWYFEGFPCC